MLSSISWSNYFIALAMATVFYYAIIYVVFFRRPAGMAFKEQAEAFTLYSDNSQNENALTSKQENSEAESQLAYACMDELNAFFENQKRSKAHKSELMYGLYSIVQKYPSLRSSEYKQSLTNVMATQAENICSIHLNAEELKGVWVG